MAVGWLRLLVKSVLLAVSVLALGRFMPFLPVPLMALAWALLAAVVSLGFAYPSVMRKTLSQPLYRPDAFLGRVNASRFLGIVAWFVLGAACTLALVLEMQRFDAAQTAVLAVSPVVFLLVAFLAEKLLGGQYMPLFRSSQLMRVSGIVAGIVLVALYAAFLWLTPESAVSNLTAAYLESAKPFSGSDSLILSELGKLTALFDAATKYFVSQTAQVYQPAAIAIHVVACVAAFFSFSALLSLSMLTKEEMKRIFRPLEDLADSRPERAVVKRYVAIFLMLPLALTIAGIAAEDQASRTKQTEGYTMVESLVRSFVGMNVTLVDGVCYDSQSLAAARAEAQLRSHALAQRAHDELEPLIEASFAARKANIDGYLDWYCGLSSRWSELAKQVDGDPAEYAKTQFMDRIEEGVDDSALIERFEVYAQEADALEQETADRLEACRVEGVDDWIVREANVLPAGFEGEDLSASKKISAAYATLIEGVAREDSSRAIALKVAASSMHQEFFVSLVDGIASALEMHDRGLFFGMLDALRPLQDAIANRGRYYEQISACVDDERGVLVDAFPSRDSLP